MRVRFTVDLAPNSNWGMNKIYAGTHWDERKQQAQQVHLLVREPFANRWTDAMRTKSRVGGVHRGNAERRLICNGKRNP